jgi:hypothetical protein
LGFYQRAGLLVARVGLWGSEFKEWISQSKKLKIRQMNAAMSQFHGV